MKKIICIAIMLILLVSLTSCIWNKSSTDMDGNDNRMTMIYNDGFCRIYVDNETGVQYIVEDGICVVVDEYGEPLIYHPAEKESAGNSK